MCRDQALRAGSPSAGATSFPCGRPTASVSRSSRIATGTPGSSGSALTAAERSVSRRRDAGTSHAPESWSSANGVLLFTVTKGTTVTLWTLSKRDGKPEPFGGVESSNPIGAVFSPDGRWVAYSSMEPGHTLSAVYVQPFPPTGATYQVSRDDDGHHPVWSRDGKELFYVPGPGRLASTSVTTQPSFAVTPPTLLPAAGIRGRPELCGISTSCLTARGSSALPPQATTISRKRPPAVSSTSFSTGRKS